MPELRRDPVTGRWVIVSTDRQKRPNDFRIERTTTIGREHCPFCPGRESLTPPEVLSYRQNGGAPNTPGWDIRVVPNKFPALHVEGTLDREGEGLFDRMNGIGAHEVIIETADHDRTMAVMSELLSPAFLMTALVALMVAFHQSSGFCSDQPGLGEEIACSAVAVANTFPLSLQMSVLVPLVPMSMPRRCAMREV